MDLPSAALEQLELLLQIRSATAALLLHASRAPAAWRPRRPPARCEQFAA